MLTTIGDSGLTQLASLKVSDCQTMSTLWGELSAALTFGHICSQPAVFLACHGEQHDIPPHQVNYRANIWALCQCAPIGIISVAAVSGIRPDLRPGNLVIPHQIINYTWGGQATYHAWPESAVTHVDFSDPFDNLLRRRLCATAAALGLAVGDCAVYAATQGPRLETAAEIDRFERDGAAVVDMTAMPEAALARELAVPYAAINAVADYAAGRGDSFEAIRLEAIHTVLAESMQVCTGDRRQIAAGTTDVHPVAENIAVGNGECDEIGLNRFECASVRP